MPNHPLHYTYPTRLEEATLIKRYKRFLADVERDDGSVLTVHTANPGSMKTCSEPGSRVRIRDSENDKRKLRFNLEQIKAGRSWIMINTALPNKVVGEALRRGDLPSLNEYDTVRSEVSDGVASRLDFCVTRGDERCWIEVKSVTLKMGTDACFPDAATERGRKHLLALSARVEEGERAISLYVISRSDVEAFRAAHEIDPKYAELMTAAHAAGVEVMPLKLEVCERGLRVGDALPLA